MPTRRSRVFFTVFSALLAAGLTAMGLHAALRAGELAERQTARLSQDLHDSYQECSTMTTAAVRTAVTFHTEALVLALDEQGSVLARTQEFLLLRDISNRNPPYFALLPGLTGAQRSALRALASRPDGSYPYGSVVYPDPRSKHPDSQACGQPLRLSLQSTGRDDECDLLLATLDDDGEAWSEWLPYLRARAALPDEGRLMELIGGASPTRSLLRYEHFVSFSPAPRSVCAAVLAGYYVTCPLADWLSQSWASCLLWLGALALGSAAAAMLTAQIAGFRQKKRRVHP